MKTLKAIIAAVILFSIGYNVCAQSSLKNYNYKIPKKLTFQIEIDLNSNQILPQTLTALFGKYEVEKVPGRTTYLLGEFNALDKAEIFDNYLYSIGYADAKVVAYFRQRRISMDDALTLSGNQNRYEETLAAGPVISTDQLNTLLDAATYSKGVYYALEIPGNTTPDLVQNNSYKAYNQAVEQRKKLTENGIEGVFITAYSGNERISVMAAQNLENEYKSISLITMAE